MKEWTTPDSRNTPSTTNLKEEETVDAPGNNGNASMPEQVKRPNPWRKIMMMMTLHVSDSFSVQRQESSTVHTGTDICHTGFADCSQQNLYDIYLLLCVEC